MKPRVERWVRGLVERQRSRKYNRLEFYVSAGSLCDLLFITLILPSLTFHICSLYLLFLSVDSKRLLTSTSRSRPESLRSRVLSL